MIVTLFAIICNAQSVCFEQRIADSTEFPMTIGECMGEPGLFTAQATLLFSPFKGLKIERHFCTEQRR
jgi:hypothetical protein